MREEAEEATGGKGEDLGHFQQRRWTKPKKKKKKIKFIIGLFARADVKAHTPAFFLGCARELYMETTTRIQGRN